MPIGSNSGGNLNVYLFQVGMITYGEERTEVRTIGVHPMVVAPRDINYTDTSRSAITQTVDGADNTKGDRALLQVSLAGSFGVESRGLGAYIGTGKARALRFRTEVVRLPNAVTKRQLDAVLDDVVLGTFGLRARVADFDPDRSVFFVNFFDFFQGRAFEVEIRAYNDSTHYDRGGASGLIHYTMQLEEVGPVVAGGLSHALLEGLFGGLVVWDTVNQLIESYTPTAVVDALIAPIAIGVSELVDSQQALATQARSATSLMSGLGIQTGIRSEQLASFLSTSTRVRQAAEARAEQAARLTPRGLDGAGGLVSWSDLDSAADDDVLAVFAEVAALEDLAEAADWQGAAGALFGQDRTTYHAYVTASGDGGAPPELSGTVRHTIGPYDDEEALQARYGASLDDILTHNGLLPHELTVDRVIEIPIRRARGSQRIDGLPVFGSHLGRAAWGADLYADLRVEDGDLAILDDEELLVQGADWTIAVHGLELLEGLAEVPGNARVPYIQRRLTSILLTDRRISSVQRIDVEENAAAAAYEVAVTMAAINGGTIRTSTGSA